MSDTMATTTTVNSEPMTRARVERRTFRRPGFRNEVRSEASRGSAAASRCSISASMRCSSIDSAIAQPPRPTPGGYPLIVPHHKIFIQLFWICRDPVSGIGGPLLAARLTPHERVEQAVEFGGWIIGEAGVDR